MRLAELRPKMRVRCDAEQALLEIRAVYGFCCTAVVLMISERPLQEYVVRTYLADDVAEFREPSAEFVRLYEDALEASPS
jgi:hypothetical protein